MECNRTVICGEIIRLGALRFTPAGLPVIDFVIQHQSRRREANITRKIQCELQAVALGETAKAITELNTFESVKISGFLSRKSHTNQQLVLHVEHIVQI
ncbi:primosomal replication protein N [Nitrosomonas marina]|uniref:Replication restart protein PriB n=1 Tax=Nitrosomonas marina TaxID=917 RepID=A0A1H8EFA2_9PROT|nr:primosomal replication protein N [Nitrosomonas marina]SEN18209.1 restart primosome assembly protein PriB [Nitrosomonas marina]